MHTAASSSVEVVVVVRPERLGEGLARVLLSPGVSENVLLLGVLVELEHPVQEDNQAVVLVRVVSAVVLVHVRSVVLVHVASAVVVVHVGSVVVPVHAGAAVIVVGSVLLLGPVVPGDVVLLEVEAP